MPILLIRAAAAIALLTATLTLAILAANGSTGAGHELLLWALINVGICILVALLRRRPTRRTLA